MSHAFIPPPPLNGGLYTGQPFMKGAPWANIPYMPDATFMTNAALRSAKPPPDAIFQYQGSIRPGNNHQYMPGIELKKGLLCIGDNEKTIENNRFFKYYYF